MSRVVLLEGAIEGHPDGPFDGRLELDLPNPGDEAALEAALSAALGGARGNRIALAADVQAWGLPTQRCAEILIGTLRGADPEGGAPETVCILLDGEPTYRIFEAVHDAARIAEQMERIRGT